MAPLQPSSACAAHRARALAILLAVALAAVLVPAGTARAGNDASELTRLVGQERGAAGLGGLQVAGDLVEVATRHARRMAAEGRLHHNPALSAEVSGWERLTENVGKGPDARRIHDALMASSSHRANILDTGVTQVGVGVVWQDGTLWVAQVFRRPTAAATPPPPAPPRSAEATTPSAPPPPAPEPEPAPSRPAPRAEPEPSTPSTPTRVSEQAVTLVHDSVARAPAPAVAVGTAEDGTVALAPTPVSLRLLAAARWLVVLHAVTDG